MVNTIGACEGGTSVSSERPSFSHRSSAAYALKTWLNVDRAHSLILCKGCVWWFRPGRAPVASCLLSPVRLLVCITYKRNSRQGVSLGAWGRGGGDYEFLKVLSLQKAEWGPVHMRMLFFFLISKNNFAYHRHGFVCWRPSFTNTSMLSAVEVGLTSRSQKVEFQSSTHKQKGVFLNFSFSGTNLQQHSLGALKRPHSCEHKAYGTTKCKIKG